ncbi:MAG: hypothetical protein EZS28_011455 [Streblomastix strix]|uniref:SPRY domain-containing protein n=1 Tax=Streblomastix strix TaxID=222440 RepID=A0A5J4WDQ4_9EUKA|nr:MAG: hypothetical protein EZS28_011455 [Streblomastix strix]
MATSFSESLRTPQVQGLSSENIKIEISDHFTCLLFQQLNASDMIGLVSILSKLSEEKSEEKKKIAQRSKKIIELEHKGQEKLRQISELERKDQDNKRKEQDKKRIIDENKKKISELQGRDEDNIKKIIDLERQLADSKSKPIINNHIVSQPKSEEIPISITVPFGSYIKKEGEFTYTSTKDDLKTFPIDQYIALGKFRFFGVMKYGPSVPFDGYPLNYPHNKNCMYFRYGGEVKQNGKSTEGNQRIIQGDLITLEVNMDIVPRTVRLFINGVLQPVYMSGIPDSIQFYV